MVEFEENGVINSKVYLADCAVGENNWQSIIGLTHNKYTFLANDGIQKAWT